MPGQDTAPVGFALASTAIRAGYSLETHESVGSTNALALERAISDGFDRHWVVARRQEAGRGRRGRAWASGEGNLASTLLLVSPSSPAVTATLGFVAGLALIDALAALVPSTRFLLKWPNDVLADGAKLSGIGLESITRRDGLFAVAVGIGVNVVSHPRELPYPATSLAALGAKCDAEALFCALSDAWLENFVLWDHGRGLAAIHDRWLRHAAGLGAEIAVQVEGRVVRGRFDTIDEACRLVIRGNDGTCTVIAAGDVLFGAVASAELE